MPAVPLLEGITNFKGKSQPAGSQVPYKLPPARYIANTEMGAALTALTGVADRLELSPWICPYDMSVDRLGALVSTGVAATNIKLLIYSADVNGRPLNKLLETANIASTSTAFAPSAALSIKLNKGQLYWVGVRHSGIAQLNAIPLAAASALDWGTTPTSAPNTLIRRSLTFAFAAPSPFVWVATEAVAATPAAVFFRLA